MFSRLLGFLFAKKVIKTRFYQGQGLGNQLWMYAVVRGLALQRQSAHKIECAWRFKGASFLQIDNGKWSCYFPTTNPRKNYFGLITSRFVEEKSFIANVPLDFTSFQHIPIKHRIRLEGNFESEGYFKAYENIIRNELQVKHPIEVPENLCLINVRGKDFIGNSQVVLRRNYYDNAMSQILQRNPFASFAIVTDDVDYAKQVVPGITILSRNAKGRGIDSAKIAHDFSLLQNAKMLIISNSSFGWWAAWTNLNNPLVIAPRFWAAHNLDLEIWSPNSILTSNWCWLSKEGELRESKSEEKLIKEGKVKSLRNMENLITSSDWIPGRTKMRIRSKVYKSLSRLNLIDLAITKRCKIRLNRE